MALKSLGEAGEASGPIFREADPIVRKTARTGEDRRRRRRPNWRSSSTSLKQTEGWDGLVELIYNTTASLNGFDQYGHFGRTLVTLTNCLDYVSRTRRAPPAAGSRFNGPNASEARQQRSAAGLLQPPAATSWNEKTGGTARRRRPGDWRSARPARPDGEAGVGEASKTGGTEPLLDYLLGP